MLGEPIDGRSLMPLAKGKFDSVDEAIGEYCASCRCGGTLPRDAPPATAWSQAAATEKFISAYLTQLILVTGEAGL